LFVKVCGIRRIEEIDWAVHLGFSAIGIVVYGKSKRFVEKKETLELLNYAKSRIPTVVVSLYYKDVKPFYNKCDFIQVYEPVISEKLVYAIDKEPETENFKFLLYDASKGSGEFKNFPSWIDKYTHRLILAGGLNTDNVAKVIRKIKPFGVDVSSGVEKNGFKDYDLMKKFMKVIKSEFTQ
jgi:phosphoribosylanthranilate isomerase